MHLHCSVLFCTCVTLVLVLALFSAQTEAAFFLHPSSDVSVSEGSLLPLSCVTEQSEQVSWFRENQLVTNTNDTRLLSEGYTSNNGNMYTIWTLVLCGVGPQSGGVYECGENSGDSRRFTISVYHTTNANFKLRLIGVDNCGLWNSNDSTRPVKIKELTLTIRQTALPTLCSTQSQKCSYDITNPSFDCLDSAESNAVTFTATLEVMSSKSEDPITANDAVALIDNWKEDENLKVTLFFQALNVDPSCSTNISAPCNSSTTPGAETAAQNNLGEPYINWIVGGVVIAIVSVCVTIVFLAVIIYVVIRQRKGSSSITSPGDQVATITPIHTILSNPDIHEQRMDTMDKNTAYAHSSFSKAADSEESVTVEGVYDNDNPTYEAV